MHPVCPPEFVALMIVSAKNFNENNKKFVTIGNHIFE